jgi:hypothetical protein
MGVFLNTTNILVKKSKHRDQLITEVIEIKPHPNNMR